MSTARLACDPLWQALCPSWSTPSLLRILSRPRTNQIGSHIRVFQKPNSAHLCRTYVRQKRLRPRSSTNSAPPITFNQDGTINGVFPSRSEDSRDRPVVLEQVSTEDIARELLRAAFKGQYKSAKILSDFMIKERGIEPGIRIYNALILSNTSHSEGSAGKVAELMEEMRQEGLVPDAGTCHAALKVLGVHVDHLLRDGILQFMREKWLDLNEDGMHDVAAGQLREGSFEQALERLDMMRKQGVAVQSWLLDLFVYTLCEADEIDAAYDIMRSRWDTGELNLSRVLWTHLLDSAADSRHYQAVSLIWNCQVQPGYLNPSSGMCLNILTTAARVGDPVLATDVFSYLSKRGTIYQPIHYELLISTYLSADPPDLQRALSILTIMSLEKLEFTDVETRPLFTYLRENPDLLPTALSILRKLHSQNRPIPIAALNLLIECYVEQQDLQEALKIYKQIHTFGPVNEPSRKSLANIHTFDLLLKGCRNSQPPDAEQASFLVAELLALKVTPTALTYDRLILVFVEAAKHLIESSIGQSASEESSLRARELLDWGYRHFTEMHSVGWMPRRRTIEALARRLAELKDSRCWDMLQVAEDSIENWHQTGQWARKHCEEAWAKVNADDIESEAA